MKKGIRAFIVRIWGDKETDGVYFCNSPGQARCKALRAARDAGYEGTRWSDLRSRRAPEFDHLAPDRYSGKTLDYVAHTAAAESEATQ